MSSRSTDDAGQGFPLKVKDIEGLFYTLDVQVGSQQFNLTLDTYKTTSILFDKSFVASNRSCGQSRSLRNLFNRSLSSSFKALCDSERGNMDGNSLDRYPYIGLECRQPFPYESVNGVCASDTYQLGTFAVSDVPFFLANRTEFPLNPLWPSDGVFPLGFYEEQALPAILDAFGGSMEVSLYFNNAKSDGSEAAKEGRITFGGKNTEDCSDEWVTLFGGSSWNLNVGKVFVGQRVIYPGGFFAQIATAMPFLEVPPAYFRTMVNALGGRYDYELDLYTVDCKQIDSLPPITITLFSGEDRITYGVQAHDFVAKICALLILQSWDPTWWIGTQFFPKRCVHLDYQTAMIGFADSRD
ncbi:eukaryotic aspartyl protease superfamily [Aphelenchoides avenae]|nr:eukaryotic aspartyl protease superfamily [Aphelenchus avenae]